MVDLSPGPGCESLDLNIAGHGEISGTHDNGKAERRTRPLLAIVAVTCERQQRRSPQAVANAATDTPSTLRKSHHGIGRHRRETYKLHVALIRILTPRVEPARLESRAPSDKILYGCGMLYMMPGSSERGVRGGVLPRKTLVILSEAKDLAKGSAEGVCNKRQVLRCGAGVTPRDSGRQ